MGTEETDNPPKKWSEWNPVSLKSKKHPALSEFFQQVLIQFIWQLLFFAKYRDYLFYLLSFKGKHKEKRPFDKLADAKLEVTVLQKQLVEEEMQLKTIQKMVCQEELEHKRRMQELEKQHILLQIEKLKRELENGK